MSNFLEAKVAPHHRHIASFFRTDVEHEHALPDEEGLLNNGRCKSPCQHSGLKDAEEEGRGASNTDKVHAGCSCSQGDAGSQLAIENSPAALELTLRGWTSPSKRGDIKQADGHDTRTTAVAGVPLAAAAEQISIVHSGPDALNCQAVSNMQGEAIGQRAPLPAGTANVVRPARQGPWECHICTYADNSWRLLRCEVCDVLRGTTRERLNEAESPATHGVLNISCPVSRPGGGKAIEPAGSSQSKVVRIMTRRAVGKGRQPSIRKFFGAEHGAGQAQQAPARLAASQSPASTEVDRPSSSNGMSAHAAGHLVATPAGANCQDYSSIDASPCKGSVSTRVDDLQDHIMASDTTHEVVEHWQGRTQARTQLQLKRQRSGL